MKIRTKVDAWGSQAYPYAVSLIWFRRDLRLADHPALAAAVRAGEVAPVYIRDHSLATSERRSSYLAASLQALDESLGGNLHVYEGSPVEILKKLSAQYGEIFVTEEFTPKAILRDEKLVKAQITMNQVGSPYAVSPGRVRKSDGTPYRVYTPFYKAWCAVGWRAPSELPATPKWIAPPTDARKFPEITCEVPPAGEVAALKRWHEFYKIDLARYDEGRNRADLNTTSGLARHLRWGEIHPRTILAELNQTEAHDVFRKEIAWREFYADVLFHEPHTNLDYYKPEFSRMRYNEPGKAFEAWCHGKTGYPFVDAGMRQLNAEGWMHNRLRMVVASFLIKDLHIEWQHGARYFMEKLFDADVASNAHGWQWTAGTGTDASPYYRVFNPIEQGKRFDPEGLYIKKYVPELAHLAASEVHEPWLYLDGLSHGYPERIVDHATERHEALARLAELKPRS